MPFFDDMDLTQAPGGEDHRVRAGKSWDVRFKLNNSTLGQALDLSPWSIPAGGLGFRVTFRSPDESGATVVLSLPLQDADTSPASCVFVDGDASDGELLLFLSATDTATMVGASECGVYEVEGLELFVDPDELVTFGIKGKYETIPEAAY